MGSEFNTDDLVMYEPGCRSLGSSASALGTWLSTVLELVY